MLGSQTRYVALLVFVAALWGGGAWADVEYNPERYEIILERSPFGANPLEVEQQAAEAQASAVAKTLAKDMRLCFLLESEEGEVRAGFQNLKAKAGDPKSVMLMEGESYENMQLLNINLVDSSASVMYQGKPITFTLTKAPAATTAPAAKRTSPTAPARRFGSGLRNRTPPAAPPSAPPLSPEEQARIREETKENMRQYQMEVIRAGMPPLPVPLTQEMDDQLVAEGVLPPAM